MRPAPPLTSPRLRARAEAALATCVAPLRRADPEAIAEPGLASGAAGIALALRVAGEDDAGMLARAAAIAGAEAIEYGLFAGIAGVGWLLACTEEEDATPGLEVALLAAVEDHDAPLDLLVGLSGLAVFAAERMPSPDAAALLAALGDRIAAQAAPAPGGLAWAQRAEAGPRWDLGISHGAPGPLSALALAHAWGLRDHGPLLARGLDLVLAHDRPGAPYPAAIDADGDPTPGRTAAWCYGGIGVGAWVMALGDLLARDDLRTRGAAMLRRHAALPPDTTDPALCHGDAGVAVLLAGATRRDASLAPLAEAAITRLLERLDAPPELAPLATLEGAAGVALALGELLAPGRIPWPRLLLADLRAPAR